MKNYQNYSSNAESFFTSLALVSAYNAHTFGDYDNVYTQKEPRKMYCLFLILEGAYSIETHNGVVYTLEENTLHFNCYQDMKRLFSKKPSCHHICYFFYTDDVDLPLYQTFKLENCDKQTETLEAEKIIRLMQTRLPHKQKYANAYFTCKLLNYLERLNFSTYKSAEIVDEILRYINARIDEPIQIKEIADFFHYSEKHIHHLFTSTLGVTPKQFINDAKLQNVKHFLQSTDFSVRQLAEKCGFATPSHLINNFKKAYGVTPASYRRSHRRLQK